MKEMNLSSGKSHEISVRKHPRSGELNPYVKVPAVTPVGEPRVTILIHGFNVNEEDARSSYKKFVEILREHRVPPSYVDKIWQFYWPGNKANLLLSIASYAEQVPKAREAAALLSSYLCDICMRSPKTEFLFVAHSLGCRLLMEALMLIPLVRRLYAYQIKLATLMAAAIPSYMISENKFNVSSETKIAGLFSHRDWVLQLTFPPGQTMAREGRLPKALGYCGEPSSFWTADSRNTGLRHSGYWSDYQVARFIASKMGVAVQRDLIIRYLSKRETVSYKNGELIL